MTEATENVCARTHTHTHTLLGSMRTKLRDTDLQGGVEGGQCLGPEASCEAL